MIDFIERLSVRQKLFLIVGAGLLLRLYAVFAAVTISMDSISFLRLAESFASGDIGGIMDTYRPPLYPFFISIFSYIFGNIELSARLVSMVFGTLTILFSFYFARLLFNEKIGIITALFVAFHPYLVRYSGDALTETLYHFILLLATLLSFKGVMSRSLLTTFLAGVVIAFAYMTKPGAVVILPLLVTMIVFYDLRRIGEDWQKRILLLIAACGVFLLVGMPYFVYLYQQYGEITITKKYDIGIVLLTVKNIFTTGVYAEDLVKYLPESISYPLLLIFLWGIIGIKYGAAKYKKNIFSRQSDAIITRNMLWLLLILFYYCIVYTLIGARRRYFLHMMPFGLAFAAIGFCYFREYLSVRFEARKGLIIAVVLLCIITVAQLPKGLKPVKAHRLPEKLAGQWFLKHKGAGIKMISNKPVVVYYSKGVYVDYERPEDSMATVIKYAKKNEVGYIAGYPAKLPKKIPDFHKNKGKYLEVVESFQGNPKNKVFVIYRIIPDKFGQTLK